ncbi:phage terminase large subunit [Nitrincola sp. A-D6]|uniref:phage terminase large subunit n=1 Tax=Nitrincola sp. A-D6 TaxID=1545442 RepID=UPI00190F73C3|nr:phage terminase large subunit [Nitrincola sp. A-D6]
MERVKEDFRLFLYLIWEHLMLPEPTAVQYDIAKYLQHGDRRICIQAFRGIGKSWITSAFVVWLLFRNPQLRIMVVSASKERADAFSSFTKRLIGEVDWLAHLAPRAGQRNSMIAFDVGEALTDHSPSVKSVGITGQLTGSRADLIIADDIEVSNNSSTQTMRDKLANLVKEFDAVLKPNGRVIYLGTPQTEMSIYNQLPDRGYQIRIWPALYPTEKQVEMYQADWLLGYTLRYRPTPS